MGLAGVILKRQEDTEINKLIRDVKEAAEKAGLELRMQPVLFDSLDGKGVYTTANIADTYEDIPEARQWLMYLYSDDDCLDRFDWIVKNGHIIRAVIIEDFAGCEKILLDFLYEYFRLNPKDYFWDELDWYYVPEDIIELKQKEFDPDWCYKRTFQPVKERGTGDTG